MPIFLVKLEGKENHFVGEVINMNCIVNNLISSSFPFRESLGFKLKTWQAQMDHPIYGSVIELITFIPQEIL
jgi:hypothetical protein